MQSLIKHLHAFVREVEPTQVEWATGIDWRSSRLNDRISITKVLAYLNWQDVLAETAYEVKYDFVLQKKVAVSV